VALSRRPSRLRRLALIAVALLLALPAVSQAAGATSTTITPSGVTTSPFSVGIPQSSGGATTTTATSTIATSGSTTAPVAGSFSTLDVILVVAGVLSVMLAIIVYVGRDSRRTARALGGSKQSGAGPGMGRHQGSKALPRARKMSAAEKKRRKRGRAPRRR
jgi:hypothetical protein